MKYCMYCGTQIDEDSRFCSACGKKLIEDNPAGEPPAEVTDVNSSDENGSTGAGKSGESTDFIIVDGPDGKTISENSSFVIVDGPDGKTLGNAKKESDNAEVPGEDDETPKAKDYTRDSNGPQMGNSELIPVAPDAGRGSGTGRPGGPNNKAANSGTGNNYRDRSYHERSIAIAILLSIITCGIFAYYWLAKLNNEVNEEAEVYDGMSGGMVVLLSIVTCGIYLWYWMYKTGEKVSVIKRKRGDMFVDGDERIIYLVLGVVGLSTVSYALIQSELNKTVLNA